MTSYIDRPLDDKGPSYHREAQDGTPRDPTRSPTPEEQARLDAEPPRRTGAPPYLLTPTQWAVRGDVREPIVGHVFALARGYGAQRAGTSGYIELYPTLDAACKALLGRK